MTREEIIKLAIDSGLYSGNPRTPGTGNMIVRRLERFAALVAAAAKAEERERCATLCDLEASEWGTNQDGWYACRNVAAAIRELK